MLALQFEGRGADRLRQWLNLLLAFGMPATTFLAFYTGTSFDEATESPAGRHPVIPASYAFSIWTLIYSWCVAYGVFQALPSQQSSVLLRRIGWYTASAFLGLIIWLLMARFGFTWLTVACIIWILASLCGAFIPIVRRQRLLTVRENYLVAAPISVFVGWLTVATFANIASALKDSGWESVGFSEQAWAVLMILAAGAIASAVTLRSRGNVAYALTIVWALIGIAVANVMMDIKILVSVVAALAAVVVTCILIRTRVRRTVLIAAPLAEADGGE